MALTKSQIDRLGERLKAGDATESDLHMLDEYRRSFAPAHDLVVETLRQVGVEPSSRRAKSTQSVIDKLRRESIRLSQIQDIAGCRIVVRHSDEQDRLTADIAARFKHAAVVDRRTKPSHGYRAIHVIVDYEGLAVEIQIRTLLQHLWAEFSEKASDVMGIALKYGGGNPVAQETLLKLSDLVRSLEDAEQKVLGYEAAEHEVSLKQELLSTLLQRRENLQEVLRSAITTVFGPK